MPIMMLQGFEWVVALVAIALYLVVPVAVVVGVVVLVRNRRDRRRAEAAAPVATEASAFTDGERLQPDAGGANGSQCEDQLVATVLRTRLLAALTDMGLTDREREVLLKTREGKTFASLADELGVSRSTVGTYCARAYEKLGVASKDEAAEALTRMEAEQTLLIAGLSEREAEVAVLAVAGDATADIAARLVLSEATVASHLQQAYAKLGVHSRDELKTLLR